MLTYWRSTWQMASPSLSDIMRGCMTDALTFTTWHNEGVHDRQPHLHNPTPEKYGLQHNRTVVITIPDGVPTAGRPDATAAAAVRPQFTLTVPSLSPLATSVHLYHLKLLFNSITKDTRANSGIHCLWTNPRLKLILDATKVCFSCLTLPYFVFFVITTRTASKQIKNCSLWSRIQGQTSLYIKNFLHVSHTVAFLCITT